MNRLCMGCMKEYDDRYNICPHCGYERGTPAEQVYHIAPGTVLHNRYIMGRVLGFGSFGVTYIGWDYTMERRVAIKEYLPSEFVTRTPGETQVVTFSGEQTQQFGEGLERFIDEARRLAQFGSVGGIVQIFDCFIENGTSYIVMEYLEGMTLKAYLEQYGNMTVEQALPVILQLASAMEAVHGHGILHRDIAPDNIYVLNPDEPDCLRVKLLDFGAARFVSTRHSKSLSVILKPGYAPEEQYRSRGDQGEWTDVYALAATFYKMLTGETPEDSMERSAKDELKKPSKLGVWIPPSVENALMNALHIKIEDRTQSMREFAEELLAEQIPLRKPTVEKKDKLHVSKWFLGAAGVGMAMLVAAGVLINARVIDVHLSAGESRLGFGMTRVPNVVNKEADEAELILKKERLDMVRDRAVYSDYVPENVICYQGIRENAAVKKNTPLVVWVSKGVQRAVVPFVTGYQREEVLHALETLGFTNIRIHESMEEGLYDSVLSINQEEGDYVPVNTEIVLTVCMQEALTDMDADEAEIPDLTGMMREEAEEELEQYGFFVNWVGVNSELPEGTIVGQTPGGGVLAPLGSYVTVRISRGPETIYMEYLLDIPEQEARERIRDMGLQMGTVERAYSDTVPEGNVISQSIELNQKVVLNSEVSLVVSRGKEPVSESKTAAAEEASRQAAELEAQRRVLEEAASAAAAEEARRQAAAASAAAAEDARRQAAAEEAARQAAERQMAVMETSPQTGVNDGSGTILASGDRTVSKKKKMPDLTGLTREEALMELEDIELRLGSYRTEYHDTVPRDCVIDQNVSPGKTVKSGDYVTLTFSRGMHPSRAQTASEEDDLEEDDFEEEY